jgi:hypothetical protein
MKKLLLLLVLSVSAAFAQTSVACVATGYCGNSQTTSGHDSTINNVYIGISFTVNSGYTITNLEHSFENTSGNAEMILVCDSNTTGGVIGNASPCPTGNVLCRGTAAVASGTVTFPVSGCGTLSTGARYWVLLNVDNTLTQIGRTTTGTPVESYAVAATFGSYVAGSTFTQTMGDSGLITTAGVTLAAGGTVIRHKAQVINR